VAYAYQKNDITMLSLILNFSILILIDHLFLLLIYLYALFLR